MRILGIIWSSKMSDQTVYNKQYAKKWIRYEKSGQDVFRDKYLYPYLQKTIAGSIKPGEPVSLLDIGCGWGGLLDYLPEDIAYVGIDPVPEFFAQIIMNHLESEMTLKTGELPSKIPVQDNHFDIVVCSMTLHCIPDLETSVNTIFSKAKSGGKMIITEFNDNAPPIVRKSFRRIEEGIGNYVRGAYSLSNTTSLIAEAYFHGEEQIEKAILTHSDFRKTFVGPLFVGYESVKWKFL
jgi:ubiquinone/menaquinone biosynthesis C-methylase UbiE